ncbi:helix-turn-helix transcriptional regulator [Alicyclobacillus mali]|uniref:Helix-turn-helix transcriptional regulator n=1 Tax=Alicyclobacillus mali (ex Roth et al. 2021) TaxID=1123961 RepID=A0ABS0F5I8_9BACL|nr:helix-turn-helix transcriptional regulator [Alicyclobacillus mali (ex Roth et al. 2021)]MBF8378511.1 helix-turn-helix transcriptional regulator [Alicyclobacillus mali (ex Roth et al. 2021)]
MTIFSERLRMLRRQNGLTQLELATAVQLSERVIRYYESGEREPVVSQLIALADFFNVSLDYLVGRTDDPTPPKRSSSSQEPGS